MSQEFPDIAEDDTLEDSFTPLMQRFATLLSASSGTSFPASPVVGQFCHRTDLSAIYCYIASTWTQVLPATIRTGTSSPTGVAGQLFFRTDLQQLMCYDSNQGWFAVTPGVVQKGTSFPYGHEGRLFYRTDLAILYIYNGGWTALTTTATTMTRTHTIGGTGVAARTAAVVTSDWANAADWGVTPSNSGGTDQKTNMLAGINALGGAGGGRLILPRGIIPVTGDLSRQPKVIIEGQGQDVSTLYLKSGSNTNVAYGLAHGGGWRDLTIDGNASNQSAGNGIIEHGSNDTFIERVTFRNIKGNGCNCEQNGSDRPQGFSVKNSTFENIGSHAISLSWVDDLDIDGNIGRDIYHAFVNVAKCYRGSVRGNRGKNSSLGTSDNSYAFIRVSNESEGIGLSVNEGENFFRGYMVLGATGCTFTGNIARTCAQQGWFISKSDEGNITRGNTYLGNKVFNAGAAGGGDPSSEAVGFFCRGTNYNRFIGNDVEDTVSNTQWAFVFTSYLGVNDEHNTLVGNGSRGMGTGFDYWEHAGLNTIANNTSG